MSVAFLCEETQIVPEIHKQANFHESMRFGSKSSALSPGNSVVNRAEPWACTDKEYSYLNMFNTQLPRKQREEIK
jgi:hypothetical protein